MSSEESRALIQSLIGELLAESGKPEEGFAHVQQALQRVRVDLRKFPVARAHYDWVTERYSRIALEAGHAEEAQAAQERYRAWREEQRDRASFLP